MPGWPPVLSDPEIASRLFLSPRTVQYHLGKVFTKRQLTSPGMTRRGWSDLGFREVAKDTTKTP